jgi:ectoine hydroxylase-related dioxygenase (phytanoyl-CoA dioxygenase family)
MQTECVATAMRRSFRDDALQRRFDRDGYVVVDCLSPTQVSELRREWDARPDEVKTMAFSSTLMSRDLEYRNAVHQVISSQFAAPANGILDRHRLVMCNFINKQAAQQSSVVEMHQDWTFVDESLYYSIGVWCPLVDVDEANGCLRVVPGSHRLNRRPRGFHRTFPYPELLPYLEERYIVDVPMKAGQAFLYTQTLFHSSPPNRGTQDRVVAGALFVPEESQLYFLMPEAASGKLGRYAVPDEFYRTLIMGNFPKSDLLVGTCDDEHEELSRERLNEILRSA